MENTIGKNRLIIFLSALTLLLMIWSGYKPYEAHTWILEVFPILIWGALLAVTYKRFKFTNLVYTLIFIHFCILAVGGHYTYAEVPLFNWIRDAFDLQRNNYDKVGHLAQGFIPALFIKELMIRTSDLKPGRWLNFCTISIILAFSAFYELIEWWAALAIGEDADSFLGTQGYIWDTQSDMFYALCGGCLALILFSKKLIKDIEVLES